MVGHLSVRLPTDTPSTPPSGTVQRHMVTAFRNGISDVESVLTTLIGSNGILDGLRGLPTLVDSARRHPFPDQVARALVDIADRHTDDSLSAYLALQAASRVASPIVDEALLRLVKNDHPGLREHAAWALSRRHPLASAVPFLIEMAGGGGFG